MFIDVRMVTVLNIFFPKYMNSYTCHKGELVGSIFSLYIRFITATMETSYKLVQ